ncbi:MAG: phage portal protein [Deltaproteobacteria bacterium]
MAPNWFNRLFNRAQDGQPTLYGGYIGYYPARFLPADTYLTHDQALSLSAVWGCVQYISQSLAGAEVKISDLNVDGKRKEASSDRVYRLLNLRPNPDTTAMALKEGWISQALVFGDGYLEIRRDMAGRPYELYLLPSVAVVPRRDGDSLVYDYKPTQAGIEPRMISGDDIIHLRGPSLYSFLGESVVTRAARSIALAKAQDEFALAYYVNSTIVGGILKRTGPMNKEDIAALEAKFESARKGAAKAHKNILLPQGVEYQAIQTDAQKSQSVESRAHSVVDICRFFGVPPPLVGDLGRATWANLESLYIQAVRDCLGPWSLRMAQEIEWKAFGDASTKWVEVELEPLTRGDAKTRAESNQILRQNGIINANEWREELGLDTLGADGDVYIVESKMKLLDEELLAGVNDTGAAAPAPGAPPAKPGAEEPPEPGEPPEPPEPKALVRLEVRDVAAFHQWLRRRKAT